MAELPLFLGRDCDIDARREADLYEFGGEECDSKKLEGESPKEMGISAGESGVVKDS